MDSIILEKDGRRFFKSSAAIRIALFMRAPWPLLCLLIAIPHFIRDRIYDRVARNRHRWSGGNK